MSEPFVRPDVRGFLQYLNAMPGPKMHELDPPGARGLYVASKDITDPPVGDLGTMVDLAIPGPGGVIPARLFDPRAARAPGPVVMFYHGGGFVIGDLETHASFCAELARVLDLPVVAVDYRLAPENPWPAAPDDAEAAARWVAGSPAALGRAVTSLVMVGDSAGGNLAIVTAMALRDQPAAVPVVAQLPFYPATDYQNEEAYSSQAQFAEGYLLTQASMTWFRDAYRAEAAHIRTSPLHGPLAGMPPAVVVTASLDPIRDQGRAYAGALARAGVPVVFREAVGNIHGFVTLRQAIPSSASDVAAALATLKAVINEAEGARVMAQAG